MSQYANLQLQSILQYHAQSLRLLKESCSFTVDKLEEEFGHDIVFSTKYEYTLTKQDLQKMFNILNQTLFNDSLKLIRVEYWDENTIVDKLNEYEVRSGSDAINIDAPCYGVFAAVNKEVRRADGTVVKVSFHDQMIMINRSRLANCIFIFAVACLCHEMIHYYDHFTDEYVNNFIKYCNINKKFNSHLDKAFQQKMMEANDEGIDVVEDFGPINTYQNANNKARYKLFRIVGEDDDQVRSLFDGHTLAVSNKQTGVGFFAMFD